MDIAIESKPEVFPSRSQGIKIKYKSRLLTCIAQSHDTRSSYGLLFSSCVLFCGNVWLNCIRTVHRIQLLFPLLYFAFLLRILASPRLRTQFGNLLTQLRSFRRSCYVSLQIKSQKLWNFKSGKDRFFPPTSKVNYSLIILQFQASDTDVDRVQINKYNTIPTGVCVILNGSTLIVHKGYKLNRKR